MSAYDMAFGEPSPGQPTGTINETTSKDRAVMLPVRAVPSKMPPEPGSPL